MGLWAQIHVGKRPLPFRTSRLERDKKKLQMCCCFPSICVCFESVCCLCSHFKCLCSFKNLCSQFELFCIFAIVLQPLCHLWLSCIFVFILCVSVVLQCIFGVLLHLFMCLYFVCISLGSFCISLWPFRVFFGVLWLLKKEKLTGSWYRSSVPMGPQTSGAPNLGLVGPFDSIYENHHESFCFFIYFENNTMEFGEFSKLLSKKSPWVNKGVKIQHQRNHRQTE